MRQGRVAGRREDLASQHPPAAGFLGILLYVTLSGRLDKTRYEVAAKVKSAILEEAPRVCEPVTSGVGCGWTDWPSLDEVIDRDEQPDGINPTSIKGVMKAARDAGISCSRAQAVWCLKRTNGQEPLATEMITAQRSAKRALEAQCKLKDPCHPRSWL